MRTLIIALALLMLSAPQVLMAQNESEADTAEARAEREALRAELEQARGEVAEAARKLARIQRELADGDMHDIRVERLRALEGLEVELGELDERIHHEVIRGLRMSRPRLGILLGDDDQPDQIVGVTPGSGAEKAGIEAGDRLVSINGQSVDAGESGSLRAAMEGVEVGDVVPVAIDRDGERLTLDVEVSSPARDFRVITHDIRGPMHAPAAPGAPDAPRMEREVFVIERGDGENVPHPPAPPMPPRLAGLGRHSDLISNHEGLAAYFGTADGVVVLRIDEDNPLRLRDGDVVLSIDGEAVSRPVEIGRAILGQGGRSVSVEVMRNGERVTIEAELPESRAVSAHLMAVPRGL